MPVIDSGWWKEEEGKKESDDVTPDATVGWELNKQPFASSIVDDDVIGGSGVVETSQLTSIQTVFTSEDAETSAMAADRRFIQYGLIGLAIAILTCVTIAIFVKTRKRPRFRDLDDDMMTSSVIGETGEKYYEIGENSSRRSSKVKQAFHSTNSSGWNAPGLSERAMTYNVLYALEQQDPDYAVIDECTQPEQTSEKPSNSDTAVYAIVNKSKSGHSPVISQSDSKQSNPNYMEFQSGSSSSSLGHDETKKD